MLFEVTAEKPEQFGTSINFSKSRFISGNCIAFLAENKPQKLLVICGRPGPNQ